MIAPKNTKSFLSWLFGLAYVGLFVPIPASNVTLALLLGFCVLITHAADYIKTIRNTRSLQLMVLYYALYLIGLLYTNNLDAGFFVLEKKASLLLIPLLVIPALQTHTVSLRLIVKVIGYLTMLSGLVLLAIASWKWLLGDTQSFYFENFSYPHYVYYSIYFSFGSLVLLDSLVKEGITSGRQTLVVLMLFVYVMSMLVLIASKAGLLTFGLGMVVILVYRIESKRLIALSLISLFIMGALLLTLNETTRGRFLGLGKDLTTVFEETIPDNIVHTNINIRLLFWRIALTNAWKDGLIVTGTGTGDAQDYLNTLYALPQYKLWGFVNWDSHNQWVFTLIQLGLIGVTALALIFGYALRVAHHHRDVVLLCFLLVTLGYSMSESILESNKGIVFFALTYTFLTSVHQTRVVKGTID